MAKRKETVTPKALKPSRTVETEWHEPFLKTLALRPVVRLACKAVNISRQNAYLQRKQNPEFAQKWDEAIAEGIERYEAIAWERAEQDSDTLLIFMLKSHKPSVYRERFEHTGKDGGPIETTTRVILPLSDDPE